MSETTESQTAVTPAAEAAASETAVAENAAPQVELTEEEVKFLEDLEEAMRDVVDPELGINVVDLGLVYGMTVTDGICKMDMTLTSPACPLTDVIEDQSRNALVRSGLVDDLQINWVWMPPWGPDKITDDGREQLRALGFTV
ncbi:metal-sulfur cluster assembly factor [Nocardia sp. NPDC006630]|uniref:metal-sulfur cluster assembly factor n=1 Tax=Nocardia sp. NPDC006630 TaxID=3157181 RepID=UPI0033BB3E8C